MSRDDAFGAVFDCMVYLQAAISESGPAAELLRLAERGSISLFVDRTILQELRDVVSRPTVVAKYPFLTPQLVESFFIRISQAASFVTKFPPHFSFPRDPKDEKYINLAIEAKVEYLVSRDRDLLDLMTYHTVEAKEFRQRFRPLKVVDPGTFLEIVRAMNLALRP